MSMYQVWITVDEVDDKGELVKHEVDVTKLDKFETQDLANDFVAHLVEAANSY